MELESILNEKNKNINTLKNNINDLENKNLEIMIDRNRKVDEFKVINNKYNKENTRIKKTTKRK